MTGLPPELPQDSFGQWEAAQRANERQTGTQLVTPCADHIESARLARQGLHCPCWWDGFLAECCWCGAADDASDACAAGVGGGVRQP